MLKASPWQVLDLSVNCRSAAAGYLRLKAPQPLGSLVQRLREIALEQDWGDKDTRIIAKVLEELADSGLAFEE